MRRRLTDYAFLLLVAGAIVAFDQTTKYFVRANLPLGQVYRPELWISQYARIVHLHNSGAAIGIFPSLGNVFMVLSLLVSVAVLYYYPRIANQGWLVRLSMAMILGGGLGNLVDRLRQGYVTDFISIMKIPVFNLADLCIPTGVLLLYFALQQQKQRRNRQDPMARGDHPGGDETTGRTLTSQMPLEEARSE